MHRAGTQTYRCCFVISALINVEVSLDLPPFKQRANTEFLFRAKSVNYLISGYMGAEIENVAIKRIK